MSDFGKCQYPYSTGVPTFRVNIQSSVNVLLNSRKGHRSFHILQIIRKYGCIDGVFKKPCCRLVQLLGANTDKAQKTFRTKKKVGEIQNIPS